MSLDGRRLFPLYKEANGSIYATLLVVGGFMYNSIVGEIIP
jgi:hypothetical protein